MRALIGHTGFVGSNLASAGRYDAFFNSKNSSDMNGGYFSEIVCAGISAVKWKANQNPEADSEAIASLIANLRRVRAQRFILLSTTDVYQPAIDVTEVDPPSASGEAYGVHRAQFEEFVRNQFDDVTILRLPALYGPGLKKNAIFDLQNNNNIETIDPRGRFQWYDVRRLEQDITAVVKAGIRLINISSEPIEMSVIGDVFFPGKLRCGNFNRLPLCYNMKTKYASLLGGNGDYHFSRKMVLDGIRDYLGA